ncbi:MAG: UPF0182 family protein [Acidobacteriota bacterium]|nr:MAG: UPF0182 family protein [Acidobacteriota bacterium]
MNYDPFEKEFEVVEGDDEGRPGRPRWLIFLVVAILLFILMPGMINYFTEWLWFDQMGYTNVFLTTLRTRILAGLIPGIVAMLIIWLNFKLALRLSSPYSKLVRYITINQQKVPAIEFSRLTEKWALPAALLIGLFLGLQLWDSWDVFLQFRHRTSFGVADPLFGRDVGFYFFTLPFLELISRWTLLLLFVLAIGAAIIYLLRGAIRFDGGVPTFERKPRYHLLALVALIFVLFACRTWIEIPNLVYSPGGTVAGAGYTDITARLPMLRVEMVVELIMALVAIAMMFRLRLRWFLGAAAIWLIVIVGGGIVYPSMVQRFSVAPNELVRETPYIKLNIAATRQAFGLDRIEERELSGDAGLTLDDIRENAATINNIRLWDHGPLLDTFAQIQEIRTYYEFQSVDNDRYKIDGELRQIMISPRELSAESLPVRNWINETLTFTHGFGLTLGPVNQVTREGLPVLMIKDIPPVSSLPSLNVTRPEIYFGELSHDPVYVKTAAQEFNYPSGEENVYGQYEGEGGIPLDSYFRRTAFAARFGDMKLLLSNDISPQSRVLFHRNIRERLRRIAPFLRFDLDPYLVISEGRLFWIADAYTVSNRYPYSQPYGGINYIRNSVKAVIDAYNGDARLYVADPGDPLIQTWSRIFPGILKPLEEMPADLRSHLRYPEDIFRLQTTVYSTYHMDQPQIFYNKEDQWEISSISESEGQAQVMEPYFTIMKLPGEQREEFILMLPFTPRRKDNLASWMVARADGENYGKMLVYRFPKQKLIFGPRQVVARINQDADISRQLSLWNQRGSQVILGTLLVIPIKESLIYVQPLYLKAASGKIPELKRVIVAAENRIAMEETLEGSISRIFGGSPGQAAPAETLAAAPAGAPPPVAAPAAGAELQQLHSQAWSHYERAIQAQKDGDWARYGEEIKQLGALLERLRGLN